MLRRLALLVRGASPAIATSAALMSLASCEMAPRGDDTAAASAGRVESFIEVEERRRVLRERPGSFPNECHGEIRVRMSSKST